LLGEAPHFPGPDAWRAILAKPVDGWRSDGASESAQKLSAYGDYGAMFGKLCPWEILSNE